VTERIRAAFLRACEWDVAARKPGNVSDASAGHGMDAKMFRASAAAASEPLCRPGATLGERVEGAVEATWAAVGCNTNLGIVLLCAPLAMAAGAAPRGGIAGLRAAVQQVLTTLTPQDTAATFRAIARANPGGLGQAPAADVRQPPRIGLREAMALSAQHDLVARQYRDGFADVFDRGLPVLPARPVDAAAVQALFLTWLSAYPDSHIVRKHGAALAQTVMQAAQAWRDRFPPSAAAPWGASDATAWAAWDEALKSARINPGTSADLTVATLMLAALADEAAAA